MATSFLTGQRLTADLLNSNVIAFMPSTYAKAADTARNTTTTYADDPDLSGIPLSTGSWEVELVGNFYLTTTTAQSIKLRWGFTGTWNGASTIRDVLGPGADNTTNAIQATSVAARGQTLTGDQTYGAPASAAYAGFREICRTVVVTVAGNLSLQWAQNSSSGNNTTVAQATHFNIRKIT